MIPLDEQDPARWDDGAVRAGLAALAKARRMASPGPYQLEAAISAAHVIAIQHGAPDAWRWDTVASSMPRSTPSRRRRSSPSTAPSPSVAPRARRTDWRCWQPIPPEQAAGLDRYQPYHAARAALLRDAGELAAAADAYRRAIALTETDAERRFLERRLASLAQPD